MAYTHVTRAQARSQLAGLLHDTTNVFWASAELDVYLDEALRAWSAVSQAWKERGTLSTSSGTAFYDLTSSLSPSTLRGQTLTDTNLVTDIQYALLEPATGTSWTGSEQFTLSQVSNALQRRRDQFLVETGCHLTEVTTAVGSPPAGRQVLTDSVIDVRRAVWQSAEGYYTILWRDDEHAAQSYDESWLQNPGTPNSYSVSASPPLTVQLFPPPISSGDLNLITVSSGAALDPANGVVMGIPNDFCWVVKWGALADLLGKDGQAYDPARAAYCEQRWQEGIALARISTSAVQVQIANVPKPIGSLFEQDSYDGNWQNITGTTDECFLAGLNLIGFSKVPDGAYGVSVDVVRNAPIPSGDGDYLEIGREELEAIILYAQHIASFKMAGDEFEATQQHYQHFFQLAATKNGRLRAAARNFRVLMDRGYHEESQRPRVEATA